MKQEQPSETFSGSWRRSATMAAASRPPMAVRLPVRIVVLVCVVTALPAILLWAGAHLGGVSQETWPLAPKSLMMQVILGWSAACVGLFTGLLALSHNADDRALTPRVVALTFFFTGMMDAGYVLVFYPATAAVQAGPQLAYALWLVARVVCAALLVAAPLLIGGDKDEPARFSTVLLIASPVAAVLLLPGLWWLVEDGRLPPLVFADALVPRPWDLLPLALFAVAGWLAVPRLQRREPGLFSHALLISLIPQAAAQLHMAFGSHTDFDGHFNAAVILRALTYLVPLTGLVLDYVATYRQKVVAVANLEAARVRLLRQAADLAATNRRLSEEGKERQRAEDDLLMLRKAVETTKLGITITDRRGRVLYLNPAEARMHGRTVAEMIGQPANLLGPPDRRRPLNLDELEEIRGYQREREHFRGDGMPFPVQLTSDIVRNPSGEPVALVTVCEDISERKKVETELLRRGAALGALSLAAERFLRGVEWEQSVQEALALLGEALEASCIFVFENRIVRGHPMEAQLRFHWGCPPDIDAHPPSFALDTPDLEDLRCSLEHGHAVWGHLGEFPCKLPSVFRDGGVRSLLIQPVFVSTTLWGLLGVAQRDLPREWSVAELECMSTATRLLGAALQRQRDERALRESEERFRGLFENATDLIQSIDPEGRMLYVNRAWLETLGYQPEEAYQLNFDQVVAAEDLGKCRTLVGRGASGESMEDIELTFISRHGEHIVVEGSTSTYVRDGRPTEIRGIFRNITKRKEIAALKREFIATVSHELRTPLTSIYGSLRLLGGGSMGELPPRAQQLIEVADKNSQRLVRLVENIIDVEKLDSGRLPFSPEPLDLDMLVEQAVETNRAFAQRYGVHVEVPQRISGVTVYVDPDRFLQALANLLSNAVKFSPAGGAVTVSMHRGGGRARVMVRDYGPGIAEEFRDRIFERFVRAEPIENRNREGTGLGLSIARSIVERLGGVIDYLAHEDGSTFLIDLPEWRPAEGEQSVGPVGTDTQPLAALGGRRYEDDSGRG